MSSPSFNSEELSRCVVQGNWRIVAEIYRNHPESHPFKINSSGDTALHLAVSSKYFISIRTINDVIEMHMMRVIENMVKAIKDTAGNKTLAIGNERGMTALHVAANLGSYRICRLIAETDPTLIGLPNKMGETPLFLAASKGCMTSFLCLLKICQDEGHYVCYRRNNGDTILHSAISEQHFDIAYYIIRRYKNLADAVNEDGHTPLHILATKPSAFRSGIHLDSLFSKLLYNCISASKFSLKAESFDRKHHDVLIIRIFNWLHQFGDAFPEIEEEGEEGEGEREEENHPRDEEAGTEQGFKEYCMGGRTLCFDILHAMVICLFMIPWVVIMFIRVTLNWGKSIVGYEHYASLREIKERHTWSKRLMNQLLKHKYPYQHLGMRPDNSLIDEYHVTGVFPIETTKMETPLLIAAKHGVEEMVEKIIRKFSKSIFDVNDIKKRNILMLALEHRHCQLYESLLQLPIITNTILGEVDASGKSALHIAAELGPDQRHWPIQGAALQLHMEVKWYNFVKQSVAQYSFFSLYSNPTPNKIFQDFHEGLRREGQQWLTNNSQSCSLVATLIATITFATSATFPGGFMQDKGVPVLENKPIFIISVVSSFIALCSSMISVVMFLGILTSNFQLGDFLKDLPSKHLAGMISLLISIISMLITFFASHYFLLKQKLHHVGLPLYTVLCLLLLVVIIAKFPLDFKILWIIPKNKPEK